MRQKRAKAYRKLMSMYSLSFGFRQPYQVLIDSEMCKTVIQANTEFAKQLGNVLQGTVKPMITQCCIHELYLQGKSVQPAVDLAKTFERRKCNHKEAIQGDDCLISVIGETNKHRYVVATQSQPLRSDLRKIPAVPVVHINRSVMVLEPPSNTTLQAKDDTDEQALLPSQLELATLPSAASSEPPRKKKRGPKGPNPLSVKKKKTVADPNRKGKEREPERSGVRIKRKHDVLEVDAEPKYQTHNVMEHGDGEVQGRHKRKRRRKSNNNNNNNTAEDG